MTRSAFLVSLLATGLMATGCAPLLVGGAVLVGVDRRTSGAQLDDESIELRAASRLRERFGDKARFELASFNRRVLLLGEVPSAADKQTAQQIVSQVDNVQSIINELEVSGPVGLTQRANDSVITARVKLVLTQAPDIVATAFKVVTNRGTVYLMGRVTQREADRGADVVRSVGGVAKVVRTFELISEEELKLLQPAPQKPAPAPVKP
jgi:osmotically-inducible protein OsmY